MNFAIPHEFCYSLLIDLQNIKTQKLTKASENNKAKGLTDVNQGVQIHNIWHSSINNPTGSSQNQAITENRRTKNQAPKIHHKPTQTETRKFSPTH
jgi:hypothetical protein